jgi:hypothetical protein
MGEVLTLDNFKLYDVLYDLHKNQTQFDKLEELVQAFRSMDPVGYQIIGLIIQKYTTANLENVPYNGQKVEETQSVKFDIRNFDPVLQHILLDFCLRHLTKMSE